MTYTVTVDVHDLEPTGPLPASAELRIRRVYPDASGPQVVSTREHAIVVGTGPVQVQLTAGIPYEAYFTGVSGWEAPFTFVGTADISIAELYRSHQVDPTTLRPATSASLASLLALTDNGDGTATIA